MNEIKTTYSKRCLEKVEIYAINSILNDFWEVRLNRISFVVVFIWESVNCRMWRHCQTIH